MSDEGKAFKFTKSRLEALPVPPAGREYHRDTLTSGLQLCITANGTKTFYFRRKIAGRSQRFMLGRFPAVTVEDARKIASDHAVSIAKGSDPQADRRRQRGEPTIGDLLTAWVEDAKGRKRSWREDERQASKYITPGLSSRRLSALTAQDVSAWHRRIGQNHGPYTANRSLALLRSAYNAASQLVGFDCPNPAKAIKMFPEKSRERFLQGDELPRFFAALAAEQNETLRDFFVVALLTGARRSNVQAMKWADIDLNAGAWLISGDSAKAGKPIVVPLVPQAIEILRRRAEQTNGSPFAFASDSKSGHLVEPKFAWKRITDRAGIENLRLHDLRHTLASYMAICGESLPIIGKAIGHQSQATTGRYAHLSTDPVRAALVKATDTILDLAAKPVEQPKQ